MSVDSIVAVGYIIDYIQYVPSIVSSMDGMGWDGIGLCLILYTYMYIYVDVYISVLLPILCRVVSLDN